MHIIGTKWVVNVKYKADNTVERLKTRLFAKVYNQKDGVDYSDMFSPIIKLATVRLVLSLGTVKKWSIHHIDIKNIFLNGLLQEIANLIASWFKNNTFPNVVCKLNKALYGLKLAPRAWFDKFSAFLFPQGFKASTADSSLFVLKR